MRQRHYNGSPVAGSFVYTPPAGTVLGLGTAQQLSVSFTPTNTVLYNPASKTVTIDVNESLQSTFYRAININGPALVIDGNNWISSTGAPNFSFTTNNSRICQPDRHPCSTNRCKPSHDDTFLCMGKYCYFEHDGSSSGELSGMVVCLGG